MSIFHHSMRLTTLFILVVYFQQINCWPSAFNEFVAKPIVKELISKFERREIKTKINLHEQLKEAGVVIGFRTLERYLGLLKVSIVRNIYRNILNYFGV